MKKMVALILLAFLAFNSSVDAMGKKQEPPRQAQQARLSKMDWAKVAAASGGAVFCAWAVLGMPLRFHALYSPGDFKWYHQPSYLFLIPFACCFDLSNTSKSADKMIYGVSGALSAMLASGLGFYVYKKLARLRANKQSELKKIAV
jgi:hypothetical protein